MCGASAVPDMDDFFRRNTPESPESIDKTLVNRLPLFALFSTLNTFLVLLLSLFFCKHDCNSVSRYRHVHMYIMHDCSSYQLLGPVHLKSLLLNALRVLRDLAEELLGMRRCQQALVQHCLHQVGLPGQD